MLHELPRVLLYALVACSSPVSFSAALVVLRGARPRTKGLLFAVGFVVGTGVACAIGFLAGAAVSQAVGAHQTVANLLELAFGLVLLGVASQLRREQPRRVREPTGRRERVFARLERLHPATALLAGMVLGFGGPKRLTVTLLATASISAAVGDHAEEVTLVALYAVVATAVVWAPVGVFLFLGNRLDPIIVSSRAWLDVHGRRLQYRASLVLGAALCIEALARLA